MYVNGRGLTNSGFSVLSAIKLDDTGSTGATIRFVLDLGTLDLADGGEELDQIVIAGGPGKLKIR